MTAPVVEDPAPPRRPDAIDASRAKWLQPGVRPLATVMASSPLTHPTCAVRPGIDTLKALKGRNGLDWAIASRVRASGSLFGRIPRRFKCDVDEAWQRLESRDAYRRQVIAMIGALHGWRHLTFEQARAITGDASYGSTNPPRWLMDAWAVGLVDLGRFPGTQPHTLLRISQDSVLAFERLESSISYDEWLAVTGGLAFTHSAPRPMHDLATAELALRCAEISTNVATAYGDNFASADMLFGTGLGREATMSRSAGDAVLIRPDGLRVVLETTATLGSYRNCEGRRVDSFPAKVAQWTALMADAPLSASGVVVVFVGVGASLAEMKRGITEGVRTNYGSSRNRTADRVFVVDAHEWFPQPGMVNPGASVMRASRWTGRGEEWEQVGLLDPASLTFQPDDPPALLAAVSNSALLAQTPYFLRERHVAEPVSRRLVPPRFREHIA